MPRYAALLTVIAFGITAGACEDTPSPSAKGTRVLEGEGQEIGEAKQPPKTAPGVVPDLIGVTVGDSRQALQDAGFRTGEVETSALFGTVGNALLVCSQDPEPGATPPDGAKIDLVADRQC